MIGTLTAAGGTDDDRDDVPGAAMVLDAEDVPDGCVEGAA
jgi:hypothetical protein